MEELKTIDIVGLLIAIAVGMFGMFIHYYKMWLRGQTTASLYKYLFGKKSWKHTINATLIVIGAICGLFLSHTLDITTLGGLFSIFTVGYTGDSMLNRDGNPPIATTTTTP
jgi:multisubunit Na+/H+ antiporter MnhB subunit